MLVMCGIALGLHYSTLKGVPPVLALGFPVSGKSKPVEAGMAVFGTIEGVGSK